MSPFAFPLISRSKSSSRFQILKQAMEMVSDSHSNKTCGALKPSFMRTYEDLSPWTTQSLEQRRPWLFGEDPYNTRGQDSHEDGFSLDLDALVVFQGRLHSRHRPASCA